MRRTKPYELLIVRVTCKDSISHTKFALEKGGKSKPFPPENFEIAKEWARNGLLDDRVVKLINKIDRGEAFCSYREETR